MTLAYTLGALQNVCTEIEYVEQLEKAGGLERLQALIERKDPQLKSFVDGCLRNVRTTKVRTAAATPSAPLSAPSLCSLSTACAPLRAPMIAPLSAGGGGPPAARRGARTLLSHYHAGACPQMGGALPREEAARETG